MERRSPGPKLGERYRRLIDGSKLSNENKKEAHEELDRTIGDVRGGRIEGFRMKIKGIHAEAFGGQEGGRKSQMDKRGFTIIRIHGRKIKRDVIENPVESIPMIKHCAIFPAAIIQELIKMLCPPSGIVLDPYIGSGTSAVAAVSVGRRYIGIDIDPEYCEMARDRVEKC